MKPPNIIWIYCDELRADALNCYGNAHTTLQTPHLDALAESGIRFDNCFCNSPVCVASRTSILSGLYPEQTGVYHNEGCWPNYRLDEIPRTFPEVFAANGYATANFGKVHVPAGLEAWQVSDETGSGMREFFSDGVSEETVDLIRAPGIPVTLGGHYPGDRPYPPEHVTQNALRYMAEADQPYLVRLSYLQPHTPVFPAPPYDTLYRDAPFPDRIGPNDTLSRFERRFGQVIGSARMPAQDIFLAQVYYYGLVGWIDAQVGQIMQFLAEAGQREQTIVVFEADHGASLGEGGRFQKQTFAPESQRVPRLLSWPREIAGGQVRADISESLDLARTLFALAGIDPPAQFRGRNLLADRAPDAVYSTIGYGFAGSRAFPNLGIGTYVDEHGWPRRACIRSERFRLDKNVRLDGRPVQPEAEDIFLADVQADPDEQYNLAADPAYREIVTRLSRQLDQHLSGAQEVPEAYTLMSEQQQQRVQAVRKRLGI